MNATTRRGPWQVGHARGSTSKICCRSDAHRRDASVGARRGAGTISGGVSAATGSARRRIPRGRFAYQPSYRVVTWPLSGMCTRTRARNSSGSTVSVPAVGPSDLYSEHG